jgi:hypothetical protein
MDEIKVSGTAPGEKRVDRDLIIHEDPEPGWVLVSIHPPNKPDSGWAIRVRKLDLAKVLRQLEETPISLAP